jgi:hypothetical protein
MECAKEQYEYFNQSVVQMQVVRARYIEYSPLAALQHLTPIEFVVPGTTKRYLDLNQSYIYVKCKIVKADGVTPIVAADKVGPINLTLHSLFSNIDVELCGKQLSDANGLYHFRAMFETLLTHGSDVKESQLQAAMWVKDTAGSMTVTAVDGANLGLVARTAYFSAGKEVELIGRPHLDLFHQSLAIPGNCSLKLRLVPNPDALLLMNAVPAGQGAVQVAFKLKITEARLMIRTEEVSDSMLVAHEQLLQKMNMRIPLRRVTMKTISIPANTSAVMHDNVYTGLIPERIVLAFVPDASMTGSYLTNPYDFAPNGVNHLALYVNGECVPHRPFQPDFANHQYLTSYLSIFEGMGMLFSDKSVNISRDEFGTGYALWVFDLTADKACGACISPPQTGSVRLEIKFAAGNAATINVICYAEFESMIEIDKYRNVIAPHY